MNYYIADTHFGHDNIIRLNNRPFRSAEEMDKEIIRRWNSVVKPTDNVYILGDFCYGRQIPAPETYLNRLNGNKYIILGNHDKASAMQNAQKHCENIVWVRDYAEITDDCAGNQKIVLSHYPMVEWNGYFRQSIHLYGHIHNNTDNPSYRIMSQIPNAYNVGVDILDFTPRTLKEVIAYNRSFNQTHSKGEK